jgi:acetoin utilization deacetylase AcuC-like enzyme
MPVLCIRHDASLHHDTGFWHPERPERIRAIESALSTAAFQNLLRVEAPLATREHLLLVHPERYIRWLESNRPADQLIAVDGDTMMSPGTWEAALRAVGAAVLAVDEVMKGPSRRVFCAMRPPGHHAEPERAMGFCLFNQAAIAAFHARQTHGVERVAVVDFDVHHGNGTQAAFWNEKTFVYASTHQMPLFPGTGDPSERGAHDNILNVALPPGAGGKEFRAIFESAIIPCLENLRPDLLIVSAGFDAHRADPLGNLNLVEDDFAYATRLLMEQADKWSEGRLVSILEGGYDLDALGKSVAAHVKMLMEG